MVLLLLKISSLLSKFMIGADVASVVKYFVRFCLVYFIGVLLEILLLFYGNFNRDFIGVLWGFYWDFVASCIA